MNLAGSPYVITVWMPLFMVVSLVLFLYGMPPAYWLLGLPTLPLPIFMSTLADVSDSGHQIVVKRVWHSIEIPKSDVLTTIPSFLEGIGVLKLRRYVFPWGRIYFVRDWSKLGVASPAEYRIDNQRTWSPWLEWLTSLAMAVSGFMMSSAVRSSIKGFRVEPTVRLWAFILAGLMAVLFAFVRTRKPGFANIVLYMATGIVGFVRW